MYNYRPQPIRIDAVSDGRSKNNIEIFLSFFYSDEHATNYGKIPNLTPWGQQVVYEGASTTSTNIVVGRGWIPYCTWHRATAKRKRGRFGDSYMEYREQRQGRRHVYNHRARRLPKLWEGISIKHNISTHRSISVSTERRGFFAIPSNLHRPAAVIITSTVSFLYFFINNNRRDTTCTFPTTPPGGGDDLPFAPDDGQDSECNFFCAKRIGRLIPPVVLLY